MLFALACVAGCGGADLDAEVVATVSERIPTVATVSWDEVSPDVRGAYVEYGPDRQHDRKARARIDASGRASAVLLGMKAGSTYQYRAVEMVGDERRTSRRRSLETGTLPAQLPDLSVTIHDEARASGGYVVTSAVSSPSVAMVVDPAGDIVWAHQPDLDFSKLHIPRVLRSRVGDWFVYHAALGLPDDTAEADLSHRLAVRVGADGSGEVHLPIPDAHHDLFEHGDGVLVALTEDVRDVAGHEVKGDRLVEFHADGSERQVWSVWDRFEYDAAEPYNATLGWTHANAVDYDKDEDAYYVSLYALDCIVKIDRVSGETLWVLGGEDSDFALPDGSTSLFGRQHQFEVLDDGIVVFDNGDPDAADSRAVEYALDAAAGTAALRWEYHLDPPRYNVALGDVDRLPNGNTLVTFSALGQIDEVTPEGEVVWRLRSEMGSGFGFTMWRQTLYDVVFAEPPAGELGAPAE
jgi:hypothetical protein